MGMGRKRKKRAQEPVHGELFPSQSPEELEREMYEQFRTVAGVDEVGRGCLAGPVVAAAVVLPADHGIEQIRDSKELTLKQREELDVKIREAALGVAIGVGKVDEIDQINILHSSLRAMLRAVTAITPPPGIVLVDGRDRIPGLRLPQRAVIDGDARFQVIGAASIVAKVYRDRWMAEADERYPGYNFAGHKGYGSAAHLAALEKLGPCPLHRRTFRGVRELL